MESSVASTSFQDAQLSPSLSATSADNDNNMTNELPQPQYLKLEDLQSAGSPAPTSTFDNSPASVIIHSRPAKKRKSWGQELPQPKTTLPPRKRAKTDDEKEQRRIERIKRNRAAAHNSRERKRQETENLAVLLARARAELDAYRRLHGPLPDDVVLPEVTLSKEEESPAPSPSLLPSPATSLLDSNVPIKSEPTDTIVPLSLFEDESQAAPQSLDMTQHSAEMLCEDLPCLSSRRRGVSLRTAMSKMEQDSLRQRSLRSQASQARWWANLFLYLTHLQHRTFYHQVLLTLWTISPSRMQTLTNRVPPSTTRLATMPFSSTISSIRTPSCHPLHQSIPLMAQPRAATTSRNSDQQRSASSIALPRNLRAMRLRLLGTMDSTNKPKLSVRAARLRLLGTMDSTNKPKLSVRAARLQFLASMNHTNRAKQFDQDSPQHSRKR